MKFKHKGYTLSQTDYNYHYMIFAKDGRMVMHVPYNKPITEEKARKLIECYILSDGNLKNIINELLEDKEE